MKRFYKFLMPLVAIVAMALPASVAAQTTCQIKIVGEDSYGDGWNGGSLAIIQGGTTVATFNAANADDGGQMEGAYDSTLVTVTSGEPVSFVWTSGSYDDEVTIWIYASDGTTLLFTVNEPSAGTIFGMSDACATSFCAVPTAFAVSYTAPNAVFTWTDASASAWEFVYGPQGFDPDQSTDATSLSTTTATVDTTGFTEGFYDAYVRADCNGDYSLWVGPVSFSVAVPTINMATSGVDTLSTCNATIYDDGGPTGQYSTNCNATLIITPNDPTRWVSVSGTSHTEGSWDYLTIYDGIGTTGEMLWNDNISGSDATLTFGPFSSSAITVAFYSDGTVVKDGFQINVSCVDAPACPRPAGLTATNVTPDSIYLSISDDVNSEWVVIYGLSGFNPDTAVENVINTTDNFASIGGLLANTPYDIYVMAPCPDGGYSLSRMITVRTACAYITASSLPYVEDFESYGSGTTVFPTCWDRISSTADRPYINATTSYGHNNTHGLYFYAASGGYCYAIMPPVDPELDVNTLQVNFWARQYSTSYNCDFEVGVMTNPADATTFTTISRVHPMGTTYEEFEVPLASYTGTGSYVAFRAVQHSGTSTSIYMMLDDVSLGLLPPCVSPSISVYNVGVHDATVSWGENSDYNEMTVFWSTGNDFANVTDSAVVTGDNSYIITGLAANTNYHVWIRATCADGYSRVMDATFTTLLSCYPVTGLHVTPGPVSAMAEWTQSTSDWTDLTVEYKEASATSWTSATTNNNYFPMTGLTPATEYNFRIVATCVEGTSVAATANFRTTNFGCLEADSTSLVNDTIGHGTSTSSYFPTYSLYNYTLTQQIYLASDFTAVSGGQIEHIGIQMSAVPVARNIEIYMTNTSATSVSSAFIPIAESDLVWSGSTTGNITAGWNDITLTTPFNYSGGNILVTFRDMTGSWSSGNSGMVTSATSGISRYIYEDGSSYSVTNPPSGGYASSDRLNMYFKGGTCLTASTCAAPIVVANAAGTTAIDLNWVPGASETSWMVYQRAENDTAFTLLSTVSTTNYTATDLNPGLDYEFKVVAVCGDNDMAGFATASTECAPVTVPYSEDFQNADYGVYSRNCWTVGTTNLGTDYPYPYVVSLTGDETNKLCLIYNGGYLIMPEMDAQLNTLQARFTLVQGGDNVRLIIGLMSDPTAAIQNIIPLDTLIRSEYDTSSSTVIVTFPFDMLDDNATGHITFWDAFNDNYSFLDNLVIEPIPACMPVTGVTASNVTTTGATITWNTAGAAATGYLVEYGPRNFALGTGTVVNTATNSITLTGLTHSSDYDVYVYTVCTALNDTSMNSNRVRFTTPCDVATLPYFENFDNCADPGTTRSPLPNCWNYNMLSTGSYAGDSYTPAVYYTSSTGYTSSGQYCLYLYGTALTVLPEMPTTVDSLYITFHHYTSSPSSYRLIIGAVDSVTPGFEASFVPIDTLIFNANENNVLRFLSTYTGTGRYIAFKNYYNNNTYDYSYHYIDDLEVGYMPSCVWPVDVHATGLTTTTAEFAWSICQASDYEYEYGPAGFTRGTGTTGTWNSTPYSLSGLTIGTQYDIYVRGICGTGDTSEWSDVYTFGTLNADPTTVPFFCDFTDTTLTNAGWEVVNGTQNNKWYVGAAEQNGTPNALYVSNDNGASNTYTISGTSITYAYRDVILNDGQYAISYDWRANGESTWDYIRAWLVPASQMPVAGFLPDGTTATSTFNSSGVAPAGWISIDGGAKLNQVSSWQTYEELINVTAGTYHLLFMWANDGSGGTQPPAAIDNVNLSLNVCPISDITLASVSGTSMQITWTGSSDSYEIEYGPAGFTRGTGITVTTTTNTSTFTGLVGLTSYDFYLRGFCNGTDTSRWYRASFTTEMCDNPDVVAVGTDSTATGTTYYAPVNNFYNYTLTETIIDSAELGGAMNITALAYYYDYGTASTSKGNVSIWLQPTTKSTFASSSDIVALDTTTAVLVYTGPLNCSQGWNYFGFGSDFTYSGTGNLLVIVDDNSGDYDGSSYVFASQSTTEYKTLIYYSDSYDPDVTSLSSSYSGTKAYYQYRPVMQLISCGSAECIDPIILSDTTGETTATFTWGSTGASSYEVAVVEGTWVAPASGTVVADTTYTFTGLTAETVYTLGVRSVCAGSNVSEWATVQVVTAAHPCAVPTNVTTSDITFSGATIGWTLGEEEAEWDLHVTGTNYDETVTVQTNPYTLTGLNAAQEYTVTVRARCNETNFSEWSAPATFSTQTCQPVNGVSVSNLTANSATVSWTAPAGVNNFEVEYGTSGFARGNGTTVTVSGTSYTITGLTADMAYDVYVRSVCAEGVTSAWSDAVEFTTLETQGIDDVANAAISLYPNPASTTVTISGISGEATVTVVDMNGRVVITTQALSSSVTLSLSDLAQGAYFVRITGEQVNAIRKLIVR